ncbi:hypothetical protein [Phocaeicola coprocola]|uniref:hypothetical protein n=1 Tax=Phocaeicola coprocola TaxID=310298 RepID=UPI001C38ED76|nr:hypothetical protein [Phocaeicola coprocola]MBV3867553.1 hypothetical protein [Phocaeicola coprocola]MBV4008639.1 hypothetical protein [Phocaeicola coprocola]MBV4033162.1 hypothetical protein [Phocaeicola coprocola]MBV4039718.1 hypothetical protein [Phocaeicola coprocola]MBV4061379.1 hypothetical protein [Phocaeicola coprocola]
MNNARKSIIAACATMGIDIEHGTVVSIEQATELSKILKEEYGIDTVVVNKEREEIRTAMNELIIEKKPSLEFCGTPPDGKARRRERRRLERLKRKKK